SLGIEAQITRVPLLASTQMMSDAVVWDPFQVQGDAHAKASRRAVVPMQRQFQIGSHRHASLGATTVVRRSSSPSIWPSITSPALTGPTPSGVPVKIRSPGHRVTKRE